MKVNKNVPNILCIIRICLIPFVLLFLLDGKISMLFSMSTRLIISGAIFGIAMLTDMADGKIARKYNYVTDFGKFIDPIADKLLVLCVLVAFIECKLVSTVPVVIILAREFIITGYRLAAANKGTVIPANIWGKIKTTAEGILMFGLYVYMTVICFIDSSITSFADKIDKFYLVADISVWVIAVIALLSLVTYLKDGKKYIGA